MKQFILILLILNPFSPPIKCVTLCEQGCNCSNDDTCQYYCQNNRCEYQISYKSNCTGYQIHPRECGSSSFCDPDSRRTCQSKKSNGVICKHNWNCYSDYCDLSLQTCQYKESDKSNLNKPYFAVAIGVGAATFCGVITAVIFFIYYLVQRRKLASTIQIN